MHDRKQKVCINGFKSETKSINHGVPQGSVLGPIIFLLYINDFHKSITFSETFHFADDTNLLNISDDYKTLQNNVNRDLIALHNWLPANKISSNKDKTELIYFHKPRSKLPDHKIKMNRTRLFHSKKIKYLGIYIDETLMGNEQCEEVAKKLSRANGILAKSRHYVPLTHLKNIYYVTFSSNLFYGLQVWGQTSLHGVVVSMFDFHRSDQSSNPGHGSKIS